MLKDAFCNFYRALYDGNTKGRPLAAILGQAVRSLGELHKCMEEMVGASGKI